MLMENVLETLFYKINCSVINDFSNTNSGQSCTKTLVESLRRMVKSIYEIQIDVDFSTLY